MTMMVKSEISIDWKCEETNSMGNCSTIPKITDWLQTLSDNPDEYTDIHYCPFDIVERHARCMVSYLKSCGMYISEAKRHYAYSFMPRPVRAVTHCTKGRGYKKEFIEHSNCMKVMYGFVDKEWDTHMINQQVEFGILLKKTDFRAKCDIYHEYWEMQSSFILRDCGPNTEKFSRHVLSNMWPIMGLLRFFDSESFDTLFICIEQLIYFDLFARHAVSFSMDMLWKFV
ncbi:hypothetical protein QTP88_005794 [Uroleucon formosanum]